MGPKPIDISGRRFGRLIVIWPSARTTKDVLYLCLCDCGKMRHVRQGNMTRKSTRRTYSCGCFQRDNTTTHGACVGNKTPEYRAYIGAKGRCTNPKRDNYEFYGGRGIEFRFTSFEEWFAELGPRPTPNHSVDRKNPSGHYEKGNVRWATKEVQARNKRRVKR